MSYRTWTTYGLGFCVDDIKTTPEKLLKLAAMKPDVLANVRSYLDECFENGYKDEDLTIEDFNDLEGDYCEYGIAYVLYNVINEITVVYATDFDGQQYILYGPSYPWQLPENEANLKEPDVEEIFEKYISILTDEVIYIDYMSVENGG